MFIHIGYAKAASTWTQQMFAKEGSGFYSPHNDDTGYVNEAVAYPGPFQFDPETAEEQLLSRMDESEFENRVPVITSERLSGHWYTGGYDQRVIADRIHELFPDGKILIVIREQESMLNSVYRQYIKKGGLRSPTGFFVPHEAFPVVERRAAGFCRGPSFSFDMFRYHNIIEYYYELFGSENVLAIPLEVLKQDTQEYANSIIDFADAAPEDNFDPDTDRANVGIPASETPPRRYLNVFMNPDYINDYSPYAYTFTRRIGSKLMDMFRALPEPVDYYLESKVNDTIREIADGRFAESNRKTNELIKFELEELGYEL